MSTLARCVDVVHAPGDPADIDRVDCDSLDCGEFLLFLRESKWRSPSKSGRFPVPKEGIIFNIYVFGAA